MPVDQQQTEFTAMVAALFALATNWDESQTRSGRRGEYRTTGASMHRLRELQDDEVEQLSNAAGAFGLDLDADDIKDIFAGDYEYQVSFACNRFETRTGGIGSRRLTMNEVRTLERARNILATKESEAARYLTMPDQGREPSREKSKAA